MWLSDGLRPLVLSLALALAACGYQPVFAPGGPAEPLLGGVEIAPPSNADQFQLVTRLAERLGPADAPRWRLSYSVQTGSEGFSASGAARTQLTGTVTFEMEPLAPGAAPISGRVTAFAGYTEALSSANDTTALLSNDAARADANRRLMVMLADRMIEAMIAELAGAGP